MSLSGTGKGGNTPSATNGIGDGGQTAKQSTNLGGKATGACHWKGNKAAGGATDHVAPTGGAV